MSESDGIESIVDIVSFLLHPRSDVRKTAIETLFGCLNLTETIGLLIERTRLLTLLVGLMSDEHPIAVSAVKCLINISSTPSFALALATQTNVYDVIVRHLEDSACPFRELEAILLTNIVQTPTLVHNFLGHGVGDPRLEGVRAFRIVRLLLRSTADTRWVSNVLTGISSTLPGQKVILEKKLLGSLLRVAEADDSMCRRSIATMVKNLCLNRVNLDKVAEEGVVELAIGRVLGDHKEEEETIRKLWWESLVLLLRSINALRHMANAGIQSKIASEEKEGDGDKGAFALRGLVAKAIESFESHVSSGAELLELATREEMESLGLLPEEGDGEEKVDADGGTQKGSRDQEEDDGEEMPGLEFLGVKEDADEEEGEEEEEEEDKAQ
eukprot:TRINITY_DN260_c0_g2_i1.p2 TRINITY_DN260_c0_g2~~TRINITY_DN260_c0_g2_i1.p2  ORF type:complete len:384 (-),score=128.30 TRINITY_DN260_c0_g2_i1:1388-2539(-)